MAVIRPDEQESELFPELHPKNRSETKTHLHLDPECFASPVRPQPRLVHLFKKIRRHNLHGFGDFPVCTHCFCFVPSPRPPLSVSNNILRPATTSRLSFPRSG
jgi:hypothetical protein